MTKTEIEIGEMLTVTRGLCAVFYRGHPNKLANLNAWMGLNLVDHRMAYRWGVPRA